MHIYAQGSTSFLVSHNIVYMYNFCINSSLHTCITSNIPMRLVSYNRDRCYKARIFLANSRRSFVQPLTIFHSADIMSNDVTYSLTTFVYGELPSLNF